MQNVVIKSQSGDELIICQKGNKYTDFLSKYIFQPMPLDKFVINALINGFDRFHEIGIISRDELIDWLYARRGETICLVMDDII